MDCGGVSLEWLLISTLLSLFSLFVAQHLVARFGANLQCKTLLSILSVAV